LIRDWTAAMVPNERIMAVRYPSLRRALAAVALLGPVACRPGEPLPAAADVGSGLPLAGPRVVDLGTLMPGQPAQAPLVVGNRRDDAVVLHRVETSCPCVRVTPSPLRVGPLQQAVLNVTFDPSGEPDFRGSLAVDYTGRGADGEVVLRGRVDLTVTARPGSAPPGELQETQR